MAVIQINLLQSESPSAFVYATTGLEQALVIEGFTQVFTRPLPSANSTKPAL